VSGGGVTKQKVKILKTKFLNEFLKNISDSSDIKYNTDTLAPYTKKLFETYTSEIYKDINYFRSNLTRHLIVLKCIEYFCSHKDLPFEKLIKYIPSQNGSRSHKINCINELCDRGILQRVENLKDKRSTIIQPTTKILKLYSKLHYSYKQILYDFKTV
jgi:hypothetical protein